MSDLQELTDLIITPLVRSSNHFVKPDWCIIPTNVRSNGVKHRDARDWKQFHNPKDLALSLVLEATEVLEHFQWKSKEEIQDYVRKNKKELGEELADTLYVILLFAYDLGIDLKQAVKHKMASNRRKYPIKKSKGRYTKYTEL